MSAVSKKKAFLEAFRRTASISKAADLAKVERGMHYRWMAKDPKYAEAFDRAKEEAAQTLEDEAIRRANQGWMEPVFYKGEPVMAKDGTPLGIRRYSDGLMMFLLRGMRPDKYRERVSAEVTGKDGGPVMVKRVIGVSDEEV